MKNLSFALAVGLAITVAAACGSLPPPGTPVAGPDAGPVAGPVAQAAESDGRSADLAVFSPEMVQAEIERISKINRALDTTTVDLSRFPKVIGIDGKSGRVLLEDYFCWDICPRFGFVLLTYEGMETAQECEAAGGKPVYAPTPVPGLYGACLARSD